MESEVFARFATEMAAAYSRLAEGLRAPRSERSSRDDARVIDGLTGHRQRAVFEYLRDVGDDAKLTREVNDGIGYDFSNTYSTLRRMRDMGIVEMLAGVRPQRWRLAARFRDGAS